MGAALTAVLVLLGVWGAVNPGGYVYVAQAFGHVGVFGGAALLVAGWSIAADRKSVV